jgi:superfamily II DNA or RNA helicase
MKLRDYQEASIDKLMLALKEGSRRPVIQAPTGSGKTVIAAALVNMARNRDKRVLFCVPALSLIDQTVDRFRANGIFEIGVIQSQHEMTDAKQPVQICSVQTLARRSIPQADVVIIDECHVMFKVYDGWMSDPAWANVPFIGLTATPWAKGMGASGRWDRLIIGTTTQDLIERNHLSDFKCYAPAHPDLSGVKTVLGDYEAKGLGEAMDKGHLVADIVSTWLERGEDRPTICFAVNRVHAKHIETQFREAGVAAEYMDAFTDMDDRNAIIERFASGETKVICNVGVLTTGFDADVRCIILARPTKSEILYTQMIGRGLRTADGKDHCLILDHSDTTLRLGFVTDIHKTALDDGTNKKGVVERPTVKPKECQQCHFLKPPKTIKCPACGFQPVPQNKVETANGDLYELGRGKTVKPNEVSPDTYQRWYSELLRYADLRGYKKGWAYFSFQDKFKQPPPKWLLAHPSNMISTDVDNWIRGRNIKKAIAARYGKHGTAGLERSQARNQRGV